jgi:signal transduction histidine kinase
MTTTTTIPIPRFPASRKSARQAARPFSLSRWFASVGLLSIALISVVCALLLSRMTRDHLLHQESLLTTQFMESIIAVERASMYFEHPDRAVARDGALAEKVEELLEHLAALPDVLRANLYSPEHKVLWSSDSHLVGRSFADNDDLDRALRGETGIEMGSRGGLLTDKSEHEHLIDSGYYVEIYLPVWDGDHQHVVGVVELYRAPRRLLEAIQASQRVIWLGALCAGAFLYVALLTLVKRSDVIIRSQHARLLEAETLGVVGDMGAAVAHGIRNPIASIRSSAELLSVSDAQTPTEAAADIISQVDRIELWIRELLTYTGPVPQRMEPILLQDVVADTLRSFERDLDRRGIATSSSMPADLPAVRGDPLMFSQLVHGLIANAVDATPAGGRITASAELLAGEKLSVKIADTGSGMNEEQLAGVFKPFHTTKAKGLGLGLALAKRIVERYGGTIGIASSPGRGTQVEIILPAAS